MKREESRVTALRKARLKAGWSEIKVWAASRDDVQVIREFCEDLKKKTLIKNIREIGESRNVPAPVVQRAVEAICSQGSAEYATPSGATLTLLTDLARTNQLRELNAVVEMFQQVHPGNARFVSSSVPAKVISNNIANRLDYRASERILRWQKEHPGWAMQIEDALDSFTLKEWAEQAVAEMQSVGLE